MKILTANIAMGLREMHRLNNDLLGLVRYHTWGSYLTAILFPFLRGHWAGPQHSEKRVAYLKKEEDLSATFELIAKTNPDILILNEVIPEIHQPKIDQELKRLGFVATSSGLGGKYPDAHVSTLVATKQEAAAIPIAMPQPPYPGCGGGIAALRLKNENLCVIGAHMALGGTRLWREQLKSIANQAEAEQKAGNAVIFGGDCNEIEKYIDPLFSKLGLISVDKEKVLTCPISLPKIFQKSVDHIYIPRTWKIYRFETFNFHSDHLAVFSEVQVIS